MERFPKVTETLQNIKNSADDVVDRWWERKEAAEYVTSIVEDIDFNVLRTIFEGHFGKCGIAGKKVNFPSSKISISKYAFKNAYGLFLPYYNKVKLLSNQFESEDLNRLVITHVLVHELTHAVSRTGGLARWIMGNIGYERGYSQYVALNEAVTEKLSREIVKEYLIRTGTTAQITSELNDFFVIPDDESAPIDWIDELVLAYEPEVNALNVTISAIAEKSGIPADAVWHALVRSYFENENLGDSEIQWEFEQALPGLSAALKTLDERAVAGLHAHAIDAINEPFNE